MPGSYLCTYVYRSCVFQQPKNDKLNPGPTRRFLDIKRVIPTFLKGVQGGPAGLNIGLMYVAAGTAAQVYIAPTCAAPLISKTVQIKPKYRYFQYL